MPSSLERAHRAQLHHARRALGVLGLLAVWIPAEALAADCDAAQSPCVPASSLWVRAGYSRWQSLPAPRLTEPGQLSVNLTGEYAYKPLLLEVPSPDPDGREIRVVHHRIGTTLGARYSPVSGVEVGLSLPFVAYQTGAGTSAVTDRSADPIPRSALGDPRLEARYRLTDGDYGSFDAGAFILFPLGNQSAHAGEPSFVIAPELIWGGRLGRLSMGGGLGVRLRKTVDLGNASYGSQLSLQLALDLEIVERWLSLATEAQVLSGFVAREVQVDADTRTRHLERPAEWLAGVRSEPLERLQLAIMAGTALPFGSETTRTHSETFASLSAARFHGLLDARYRF
ncbi:MAG: hypothetical protein KC766_01780 [Myxococcales bacterium]|nr:hypothetical protein [Myxococcales bacterium]